MKYLFCDLDNTLLFNNEIKKKDIIAIQNWKKLGNDFIVATGRSLSGISNLFEKYLKINYNFLILNNGSLIYKNDKILYEEILEPKIIFQILNEFIKNEDIYIRFDDNGINTLITIKKEIENNIKYIDRIIHRDKLFLDKTKIYMLTLFNKSKKEVDAQQIERVIKEKYGDILEIKINRYAVDITAKNISKGSAIYKILEHEKISKNDIYTIGDSFNDISMFKINNNSFTLKTADAFIKNQANNVVENVEECIKNIIENDSILK